MSKTRRNLALLGCFVLAITGAWLLGHGSSSGNALQKFKAELKAKGEKLSIEELPQSKLSDSSDSHGAITSAVVKIGPQRFSPSNVNPMRYVSPGQALPFWRDDGLVFGVPDGTWEAFGEQLPALEPVLEEIRQALKHPDADAGPMTTNSVWRRRVNFVAIRTAAQWLSGAALMEVRQGLLQAALQNIEAFAGLANMERDEYSLVAQMIRSAVGNYGLATTWDALQAPGWTEPQLERLQRAWEAVNLADVAEKGLVGSRALDSELWRQMRQPQGRNTWRQIGSSSTGKGKPGATLIDYFLFSAYRLTSMDNDELFFLQHMQDGITAARLPNQHHPWPETQLLLTNASARLNQRSAFPQKLRYYLSLMNCPDFAKAVKTSFHNETLRRMTITAIALKRFQFRHGNLPNSLDGLIPEFLNVVPEDPMSGKALCYRLDAKLGFVLYSVGEDGKDGGGDPQPPPGTKPGLWEGRDAVWPSSSRPESMTRDR